MISIMKTVAKILLKRRSFFITTFVLPIILVFAFTALNSGNSTVKIAVLNKDNGQLGKELENKLSQLDGVSKVEIGNKDYIQDLIYHQYEMVITIDDNFTESILNGDKTQIIYETISNSDLEYVIKDVLNNEVSAMARICNNIDIKSEGIDKVIKTFRDSQPQYEVLNKIDRKPNVTSSLGIIYFLLFISAAGSCSFLLEDERDGTKDRILMGKITERQYFAAQCIIFFIFTAIPSVEHYIVCKVFDYGFGFENTILLLACSLLMSLLAVTFSIMMTSLIKNKSTFALVNSTFMIPIFMLSGAYWDFDMMSYGLQKIGNVLPIRWILMSISNLQEGKGIESIIPMLSGVLALSILFLLLSIFFTRNKMVLIKQND
ncbi:ABC transporter permease [Clostridium saccharoperbutylacetonicum]